MPLMKSFSSARGIIPGLIVLALGVLFLLDNFGVLRFWELRIYWPLILIAAGVYWVLDSKSRPIGVVAIVVGSAVQASHLGLVNIVDLYRFWPLILVVIGINLLLSDKARKQGNWASGAIVLTIGVIFQLQELDWLNVSIRRFWPVVLIVVGLAMLQKTLRSRRT